MEIIFIIAILIFSIVIHEVAHGSMANSLGDPTARYADRLTLNPIKHLDLMGSIIVPLLLIVTGSRFIIGWAKPVPVNPYNFTDQKYGGLKVSLAGPFSNLSLALIFGIALRLIPLEVGAKEAMAGGFLTLIRGGLFTLIEGMVVEGFWEQMFYLFLFIIFINTLLAIFNLIPVPPLDGSHVLFAFFPSLEYKTREFYARTGLIGVIALFLIIFMLLPFISHFVFNIFRLIAGI